jgi:transglutaminase-like putative cysteine protease
MTDMKMVNIKRRNCLLGGAAMLTGMLLSSPSFAESGAQEHLVRRQLRFSLALSNPHAIELSDQQLWLYLPATENPIQQLDGVKVSMAHSVLTDALGHNILQFSFPQFAPLATKVVTIAVDVSLFSLDEGPATAALQQPQQWLATERYIETSDPRIQAQAAQLKQPGARETGFAIYEWVRRHIQYAGYVADDLGALAALTQASGDCTEYAYLAVALARANGIPARMVGGYVSDRSIAPRAEDYHNWAELHIDGAWRLLDAQKENWLTPAQHYIAFRFYRDQIINQVGLAHRFHTNGELQVRM